MSNWNMQDFVSSFFHEQWQKEQTAEVNATPTRFQTLNRICRGPGGGIGLPQGSYIVIGGGSGQGKSLLASQISVDAFRAGRSVCYISLEMSPEELYTRWLSQYSGVPVRKLEAGADFDAIAAAEAHKQVKADANRIAIENGTGRAPTILVNSEPIHGLYDILEVCETFRTSSDYMADFFIVDYLQLVSMGDDESMAREVQKITNELRAWALEKKVCVICTSQYNNQTNRNRDMPPDIYGLYGGGSIGFNTTLTILLDHSRYARVDQDTAITFAIVGKNRHGPPGEIPIRWDYRTLSADETDARQWERINERV